MNPRDLMPSRTLRVLILALILMTLVLLTTPRGAEAARVVRSAGIPGELISSPRAKVVFVAPRGPKVAVAARPSAPPVVVARRNGPHSVVRCGSHASGRVWVAGHWERTGPRTSRWIAGHWLTTRPR